MTIHQQLTVNEQTATAMLVLKADAESLADLADLAVEFQERDDVVTDGTITYTAPPVPPG